MYVIYVSYFRTLGGEYCPCLPTAVDVSTTENSQGSIYPALSLRSVEDYLLIYFQVPSFCWHNFPYCTQGGCMGCVALLQELIQPHGCFTAGWCSCATAPSPCALLCGLYSPAIVQACSTCEQGMYLDS